MVTSHKTRTIPASWAMPADEDDSINFRVLEVPNKVGGVVPSKDYGLVPASYRSKLPLRVKELRSSVPNFGTEKTRNLVEDLPFSNIGIEEIKKLVQEISEISGVQSVRTVLQNPQDLHVIVFKITLDNLLDCGESLSEDESNFEESSNIWKQAQNKVFQTCKYLRDKTNQKWYFRTSLDGGFED